MSDRDLRNALRAYGVLPSETNAVALARVYARSQGIPDGEEEGCPDCKRRSEVVSPEQDYWNDVQGMARSIIDEISPGVAADGKTPTEPNITTRGDLLTHIHGTIDGCQRVIYTSQAIECLRYSSNDGAYFDHFGTEGAVGDSGINWSALAFCAFRQDVEEQLAAEGCDLNSPFSCPSGDCGETHENWDDALACCAPEEVADDA